MPLLNQSQFGNKFLAIPKMAGIFVAQLAAATGADGNNLNLSVALGVDDIITDAVRATLESSAPLIRITWNTESMLVPMAGGVLKTLVPLHLFFMYYFGVPSTDVLPPEFVSLRDQHIAWNMEYLKDKIVGPNTSIGFTAAQHQDDSGSNFWWWPNGEQNALLEHEVPFNIFGVNTPILPSSGFACSRLDISVMVKNHCTFTAP